MPQFACPNCGGTSALPDDWPYPGVTCPHCARPAVLAPRPSAPPARHPRRESPEEFGFRATFGVIRALFVIVVCAVGAVLFALIAAQFIAAFIGAAAR